MMMQGEGVDHFGMQRARSVRQSRAAKTGVEVFCYCGATDTVSAFQHERSYSRPSQIERRNERVMTTSYNDCVIRLHGGIHLPGNLHSLRIRCAALRPEAPMMPPPGCVDEPQRYRPRTGVR